MHIPDGFLDGKTTALTCAAAVAGVGWAARQARRTLAPHQIPLLGVTAAFVFAAQMLNFPVVGGTSGHLLGGVLASVLLGPSAGLLVLSSVLIVQCLVFADGGLLALGANVFNMAIVGSAGASGIYALVRGRSDSMRRQLMAATFAAWCSVWLASAACAAELALSGTARWSVVLPAMTGIHALIGVGEALITVLVLAAIAGARPEFLRARDGVEPAAERWTPIVYGLVIALVAGVMLSPFASALPDGLERVAEDLGFRTRAVEAPTVPALLPDYAMPGVHSAVLAAGIAGGIGTLLMFGFAWVMARLVAPASPPTLTPPPGRGAEGGKPTPAAGEGVCGP